jgi:hypothetical protein
MEGLANGSQGLHIEALRKAARGRQLLGMDAKQWAWIVLHAVLFTLLCKTDTYLSARLHGALDWRHLSGYDSVYDTSYMLGAVGIISVAGVMYRDLYASDPGWVQPGSKVDVPTRPLCQYCMVRPPMRSRHCFLSGACVVKFDHYCDLLSTPIGDLNHEVDITSQPS